MITARSTKFGDLSRKGAPPGKVAGVDHGNTRECSALVTMDEALRSLATLQQTGGSVRMGLPRTTLIAKMQRVGINRGRSSELQVRAATSVRASFMDGSDR